MSATCPKCHAQTNNAVHVTWGDNAAIIVHYRCERCGFYFTVRT